MQTHTRRGRANPRHATALCNYKCSWVVTVWGYARERLTAYRSISQKINYSVELTSFILFYYSTNNS